MQALGLAEARGPEPEWRQAHAVAALRGASCEATIIVHGGQAPNNRLLNDMHYYHAHLREWTPVLYATEDHPQGRTLHTLTAVSSSKLVLFGGSTAVGSRVVQDLNDVWEFNWRSRTWTEHETKGESPSPRSGHTAVYGFALDRSPSIFVFGGTRNDSAVYRLNIKTWSWSRLSPRDLRAEVPVPRESHSAVWVDRLKSMVISCGSMLLPPEDVIPGKDQRTEKKDMYTPGNEKSRSEGGNYLADIWLFTNTSRNNWKWSQLKLTNFEDRQGHSTFLLPSFEPRIAIWGGITYPKGQNKKDIFMKDFTVVDLSTHTFSVQPVRDAYKHNLFGRLNHAAARVDEKFLVFGGLGPSNPSGAGFGQYNEYRVQQGIMQLQIDNAVLYNSKRDGCHCPLDIGDKVTPFDEKDQRPVRGRILQRKDGIILVGTLIDDKVFIGELVPDDRNADAKLTHDVEQEQMTGVTPANTPGRVRFALPPTAPIQTTTNASLSGERIAAKGTSSKGSANGKDMRPSSHRVFSGKSGELNVGQRNVYVQSAVPAGLASGPGRSIPGNSVSGRVANEAPTAMLQTRVGANVNVASGREALAEKELAKRLAEQMSAAHKAAMLSSTRKVTSSQATASRSNTVHVALNKAPIVQPNKQPRAIRPFDEALQDQRVKIAMENVGLLNRTNSAGAQTQHQHKTGQVARQDTKRSTGNIGQSRQETPPVRNEPHGHQQKKQRTGQALEQRDMAIQGGNLQSQNVLAPPAGPKAVGTARTNIGGNQLAPAMQTTQPQTEVIPVTGGLIARPSHVPKTGSTTPIVANSTKSVSTTPEAPAAAAVGHPQMRPVQIMGAVALDASVDAPNVQMNAAATVPKSGGAAEGGEPTHGKDVDMVDVDASEQVKTSASTAQPVSSYDAAVDALPDSPDNEGDVPVILLD